VTLAGPLYPKEVVFGSCAKTMQMMHCIVVDEKEETLQLDSSILAEIWDCVQNCFVKDS